MNRVLIFVSCVLATSLLVLAVLQYRWAGRVAEADAERSLTQLRRGAALLAEDFDQRLTEIYAAVQGYRGDSLTREGLQAPPAVTDLIASIHTIDASEPQSNQTYRIEVNAHLHSAGLQLPFLADAHGCSSGIDGEGLALVVPRPFDLSLLAKNLPQVKVPCIRVELNQSYIRDVLFPALIEKYLGKDAQRNFEFSVVSVASGKMIFPKAEEHPAARASNPDVRQTMFSLRPDNLIQKMLPSLDPSKQRTQIYIRSSATQSPRGVAMFRKPLETSLWQMDIRNRTGPLLSSISRWRQGNLITSLAVESMLVLSIAFLILSMRRMDLAARQKMQFVAGVSHELRTPVSAILMLSRNQADGLVRGPDQVRQYGSLIHQQSQRLSEMVEQTLQFAGIHSHYRKPELMTVDVAGVVESAVADRKAELVEAGFEIQTEVAPDLPAVMGDPKWLEEAVGNLLSNAMKYSKDRRWIRVAAALEQDGKTVAISVEDHGIGIDVADQQRLFEPFYRGQRAVDAQIPGSGLGLSLVHRAAEAHRGSVTFSSEPDRGSSFTLHLPAAQNA